MKRLRAWPPAPPPFVLEHGSRDDYRLQQDSPSPSTLLPPAFVPLAEQNPFPPFLPPFWNHLGTYWMDGNGRGEGVLSRNVAPSELCD